MSTAWHGAPSRRYMVQYKRISCVVSLDAHESFVSGERLETLTAASVYSVRLQSVTISAYSVLTRLHAFCGVLYAVGLEWIHTRTSFCSRHPSFVQIERGRWGRVADERPHQIS